ncbi:MAG: nitrite reductase/ring-hydroxylating ferredoxin subunit/DMSO [Pseudorhodobacter sp.]|jgi:nitrite reductase/ring-hydroxylating ferredoxin subunit/DMSO/TMAO reductase YedYZ heme-binding membrane subunit
MSVKYIPVQWNANKWKYDAALLALIVIYIAMFIQVGTPAAEFARPIDSATLRMRAFGTCAFFMLTFILCIGPMARLDPRFLPLLYNRRHFGVLTTAVAFTHAVYVLGWYFNFTSQSQLLALMSNMTGFSQILGFPIEALGVAAFLILAVLSATSHDFWLSFLSAPVWKALHLLIYPAYVFVVAHVALGYFQDAENPVFGGLFVVSALLVTGLHLAAWLQERRGVGVAVDWVAACRPEDIEDKRAFIVTFSKDERVAIFRSGKSFSAVSNTCAHQGGPLGEGKILYGCVTCPWHGFSYKARNGRSPAPYTEMIPTYNMKLENGKLFIDRKANQPGTDVEPIIYEVANHG